MPRRDGTGPNGMGSRSGRGLGVCTGVNAPRYGGEFGAGYGMGGGRGGGMRARNGFGFRGGMGYAGPRWWGNDPTGGGVYPEAQENLEERAAFLEAELKGVQQRMAEMEGKNAK